MVVEPLAESREGERGGELQNVAGVVALVPQASHRGWLVRSDDRVHRVAFATGFWFMVVGRFDVDGVQYRMPLRLWGRRGRQFDVGKHSGSVETWLKTQPLRQSKGFKPRYSRTVIQLSLDGHVAGTWLYTYRVRVPIPDQWWEYLPEDSDVDEAASRWLRPDT
jgi:hypothetical protein